jgi:hypothetical protein
MSSATAKFLATHTPSAIAAQQAAQEKETKKILLEKDMKGRSLLNDKEASDHLADLCLSMGFIGGWDGRVDDYNQGVLHAAHMIVESLGKKNKARFIKVIAERAAKRVSQ